MGSKETPGMVDSREKERSAFRPELEGLRGVAVILILLYHAGFTGLPGGFIGVEVFFVLSGFLITGLLLRELDKSGTLGLRAWYARRARRILPASFLILGITLAASAVVLSPLRFSLAAHDIAAAALYVPNMLFAAQGTSYFHPKLTSPVLHFWTLGVEEQFYLLWPPFLLWVYRRGARTPGRMATRVGAVVAASLALSVVGTALVPWITFFVLPSRAWELGIGGLLALADKPLRRVPGPVATLAASLGLLLIAVPSVLFNEGTPYPGFRALAPALGTAFIIAAGTARPNAAPVRALGTRGLRYIGRISYSLYLWHWPLMVLGPVVFRGVLSPPRQALLEVGASLLLGALTYRWVENPLRHGRVVGTHPGRNLRLALSVSIGVVAIALTTGHLAIRRFDTPAVETPIPLEGDPLAGVLPVPPGGPAMDGPLPVDLAPPLLHPPIWKYGCGLDDHQTAIPDCTFGDRDSRTTVVLFGDSHALQWHPALERIATARHWRLLSFTKLGCPYQDVAVEHHGRPLNECEVWRDNVVARIAAERPALVLVVGRHKFEPTVNGVRLSGEPALAAMRDGASRTLARLTPIASRVAVIADTPEIPLEPPDCLSANADHVLRCAVPREQAVDHAWLASEREAALAQGASFVDWTDWVCPTDPCPLVIGRFLVYQDTNHITPHFAAALASKLTDSLASVLEAPGRAP